jgi:hypothetical protein
MTTKSIRILVQFDWPNDTVTRLWDGSGPLADLDGNVWKGLSLLEGLDGIEHAINGEAYTLSMALSGVSSALADVAWQDYQDGNVIDGRVRLLIQPCDKYDQPQGSPEVRFTGIVDNIKFDEFVQDKQPHSTITVDCRNRFTLRRLTNGAALSDTDQRARSAILNPSAPPDRFCEFVPKMRDKTLVWPRYTS